METRNKIGFKSYDSNEATEEKSVATSEMQEISIPMSSAQLDLQETITNIGSLMCSPEFNQFSAIQKSSFVSQLINAVSLNTELNIKTAMIMLGGRM